VTIMSSRYADALATIRPPGCGCHPDLLRVANYGVMAGRSPEDIHVDIREAIPHGARKVLDREIEAAVKKAMADHGKGGGYIHRKPDPIVKDGKAARERIIKTARITEEADLLDASPIRLWDEPAQDTVLFLDEVFLPDDLLWIGERTDPGVLGVNIKTAAAWIEHFKSGGTSGPFIIINPLSGQPANIKGGDGTTFRGDNNVRVFAHCLAEFDNIPRDEQLRFWAAVKLPIVALIDSGGKSIHAWIKVKDIGSLDAWRREIKEELYDRTLVPMGVDAACSNPSRLSRLPGHFRKEKNNYQRLLWLSAEGRRVCQ
jgi:hypothetical protein